jgi:flagellar assembly factor FliW
MANTLDGTRFGTIQYTEEELMIIPSGLVGFGSLHHFVVVSHRDDSPFKWLQSVEEPALAFLVTNPWTYEETYQPVLSDEDAESLGLDGSTEYSVWTTVNVRDRDISQMTLNLAAPIIVNTEKRVGKQVVLEGQAYNMRHRVFREVESVPTRQAA